jgi:hypothetical protein
MKAETVVRSDAASDEFAAELLQLADLVNRLWHDPRDPERFVLQRGLLARELRRMARRVGAPHGAPPSPHGGGKRLNGEKPAARRP